MVRRNKEETQSLSTAEAARLLDVSVSSVANWIDAGELKAGRTPGGHRRISPQDLICFLKRHKLPVPESLRPMPPRVLIVDDEKAITRLLHEEISEAYPDYEIQIAHDGFTAGDLVGSWKPDVVLLDLRMPGIDGYEVCRRIKAKPETERASVIAITAYYSPKAVYDILECGAILCLPKPLDIPLLLLLLKAALFGGDIEEAQRQLLELAM